MRRTPAARMWWWGCSWVETLASSPLRGGVLSLVLPPFWVGVERVGSRGGVGCGILLGPEGTTTCGGGSSSGQACMAIKLDLGGSGWWRVCGVCVLVENCTVDASIFVVKLLRADGGCLGTRSR